MWRPKLGPPRTVLIQIGAPHASRHDCSCRLRITGLPGEFDRAIYGIDAFQALELALVLAGKLLAGAPEFRAGQIELWNKPARHDTELFLPLPIHSLQGTLHSMRHYFVDRKKKRVEGEMLRNLLTIMEDIHSDLGALAAHLPIRTRRRRTLARGMR